MLLPEFIFFVTFRKPCWRRTQPGGQNFDKRIQNRRDPDYFNLYENDDWRPSPWYQKLFHFIYRILYFMTGPKFVVSVLGIVQFKAGIHRVSPAYTGPRPTFLANCVSHWGQKFLRNKFDKIPFRT